MEGTDGPPELNMSLDDIIAQNDKNKKLKTRGQHYGKSNGYQQNTRGRGRGTRGRNSARGGRFARGGRPQQQYTENYAQPERVVVVQQQAPNLEYRKSQDCYRDEYGNVIFTYKNSELVKVSRAGDVTLNTRGQDGREFRGITTLKSLNDALNCLDIQIRPSNPKFPSDPEGHWNVVDGRALIRFREGLTLPAKGPQHAARGQALMAAIKHPELPQASAATAASNAAAIQAGLLPPGSYAPGHQGFGQPFMQNPYAMGVPALAGEADGEYGFGFSDGMGYGQDSAQIRRDKARGRYMPY